MLMAKFQVQFAGDDDGEQDGMVGPDVVSSLIFIPLIHLSICAPLPETIEWE